VTERGGSGMSDALKRPSWDDYFMQITFQVARRSTCPRAAVGAVIVRDKRILTTGYNGAPRGLPHCTEVGCLMVNDHCVRTLHAEQNAVIQGALHGVDVSASTIYVTHQPCLVCAKMIINAGIERVVYAGEYPDEIACSFMEQAGVELVRYEPGSEQSVADFPDGPAR
jgi:dCMP deaminase